LLLTYLLTYLHIYYRPRIAVKIVKTIRRAWIVYG